MKIAWKYQIGRNKSSKICARPWPKIKYVIVNSNSCKSELLLFIKLYWSYQAYKQSRGTSKAGKGQKCSLWLPKSFLHQTGVFWSWIMKVVSNGYAGYFIWRGNFKLWNMSFYNQKSFIAYVTFPKEPCLINYRFVYKKKS